MILLDSNIPMYLVGADHPNKDHARRLVESSVDAGERLVTDAEVFQEILHRYVAINRRDAIQPAFELLTALADEVYPVALADVRDASEILVEMERLSARDAIHVAVMRRHGVETVMSFDRAFDDLPGLRRIG